MRNILVIFSLFFSFQIYGQNYIEYQRIINRVDEDVLIEKYSLAIDRLDSIYEKYDFIYARDCFKALQICCKSEDSINAKKWLEKSLVQGVPIWMLKENGLTKNVFHYPSIQNSILHYDSLRNIYTKSINQNLRNTIDSLFIIDQQYTRKVNDGFILFRYTYHYFRWLNNNKKQFKIINELIDEYGFPGEKIIGLSKNIEDSSQVVKNFRFYGPILRETKAYIMLIHYYSNPRPDINEELIRNVKLGNLPPYQFGALNDFMARWGKKKYGDYQYYNVWHTDSDNANETNIERRRKAIGLNSYKQQYRNMSIWRERRKEKTANYEVILE